MVIVMRLSCFVIRAATKLRFLPGGRTEARSQAEWEKVIAAAKKEGEVRLWGDQEITHPDIVAAFTKEYPLLNQ